jgi:DNA repair ATPase RecN
VFLQRIEIDRFLSFGQPAELNLGAGLTVVTGPNAAGKSNIGRCGAGPACGARRSGGGAIGPLPGRWL